MLRTFGKHVYTFVTANLPGVTMRHIHHITAKTSNNFILDFSFDRFNSRLNKIYDTIPSTKKLVVSVSMDATKVIPALITCLKFNCIVGMVTPNHILAINEETRDTDIVVLTVR